MLSKRDLLAGGSALLAVVAAPVRADDKGAPQKQYLVEIPIVFDGGHRPIMDLFIGEDGPYHFAIDTGSYAALIREDLAKTLKLNTHGFENGLDLTGQPDRNYIYQAHDVLLGGIFKLPSIDMVGEAKLPLPGIDGVLPASILTALPTELDFAGAQVRYYLRGAPQDLAGFVKLDALFQADANGGAEKVYAHVTIDGHKALCLIDTGANGHILLSGAYVQGHGLWRKNADAGQAGTVGANGEVLKTRIVKMANFEFGPMHFDDVWVELGDPGGLDNLHRMDIDGVIGTDILRQFTFAFTGHHEVYVKPNARFSPSAGARPAIEHKPDATQPVLSFAYHDDHHILLPAKVGDKPAVGCWVNTGVAKSGIAPDAAQTLGLAAVDGGFDGSALAIAAAWHAPRLVLTPRPNLAKRPFPIDLGLDFLTAQPCRIDFDVNEMTLFPDGAPDITGYSLFAERHAGPDNRFYVTVKLAGLDAICIVDTMVSQAVTLLPHAVAARNLWDAFPDAEHRKAQNGGEMRLVNMAGLDASGLHLAGTPVLLADPAAAEARAPQPFDAMLGMDFLHRCNWIFTPDGKLYAKPNSFWTAA